MFRNILSINKILNLKSKKIRKILICPDKFKFSLSSMEVADAIRQCLSSSIQGKIISLADGGEGSLDVISQKVSGKMIKTYAYDPLFRRIQASYFESNKGEAFIEMAKVSGLNLLVDIQRNPLKTSTIGTGQLIAQILRHGIKKINLLIGGSATNDGGIGCAQALGYCFYDQKNKRLKPIGQNLTKIASITHQDKLLKQLIENTEFKVYTDVKNPLLGLNGASYIFGPQKGANQRDIQILERGMKNLNEMFIKQFKVDPNLIPGSGAAGGLGAGSLVFLNAKLFRGIDLVFQTTNFQKQVQESDLIITGEGKFDSQTMEGKVVKGVLDLCFKYKKPVIVLCALKEMDMSESSDQSFKDNEIRVLELLYNDQKSRIEPQVTRLRLKSKIKQLIKELQ